MRQKSKMKLTAFSVTLINRMIKFLTFYNDTLLNVYKNQVIFYYREF